MEVMLPRYIAVSCSNFSLNSTITFLNCCVCVTLYEKFLITTHRVCSLKLRQSNTRGLREQWELQRTAAQCPKLFLFSTLHHFNSKCSSLDPTALHPVKAALCAIAHWECPCVCALSAFHRLRTVVLLLQINFEFYDLSVLNIVCRMLGS